MSNNENRAGLTTWILLAILGIGLAVWGIASGSLPLTLAPAAVAIGAVVMAIRISIQRNRNHA